jgi:hypothetical protein
MATRALCDGTKRRDFLKVGVLGGLGLNLSTYLKLAAAGEVRGRPRSAIYLRLGGGPSHIDMFDMKPEAPAEYRGELRPIPTNVPGIEICEKLPNLARCADRFAILRGVSHTLADHTLGSIYLSTGNRPLPSLQFPGLGAVASKELTAPKDLPPFVAIPNTPQTGGYLGLQYAPFSTSATPKLGERFDVRGIAARSELTLTRVGRREKLLSQVDNAFREHEADIDLLSGLDEFSTQAYNMITSPRARTAFDTSQEPSAVAQRFGATELGQSCLLACRLVEAGVPFVTVSHAGWDMHDAIFKRLDKALPEFDAALAALLTTLADRGLLDTTSVIVTGEFGRTPKMNGKLAGRDHWPRAMFVLLAGGGVRGGQVLGASDDRGMGPAREAFTPEDVAATYLHSLGIDPKKEYHTSTGRPVMIVRDGKVISPLFG